MSAEIVFDDSDIESDIESEEIDESEVDEIEESEEESDVNSEDNVSGTESDDITFESDDEEDETEGDMTEEDPSENMDCGGGIDISEFYDDGPKNNTKSTFGKRKHTKPPKVAKSKRMKKKNTDITIQTYILSETRENIIKCLTEKLSDNSVSKNIERNVYNYVIKQTTEIIGRSVKKNDLSGDIFIGLYNKLIYEIVVKIMNGVNCEDIINTIKETKFGLKEHCFENEKFIDKNETDIIENPPKVISGIHTCSVCIKDESKKNDPERGKRVDSYQLQTRSCDEPAKNFQKCLDCHKRWCF